MLISPLLQHPSTSPRTSGVINMMKVNTGSSSSPYLHNADISAPVTIQCPSTETVSESPLSIGIYHAIQEIIPDFLGNQIRPQDLIIQNLTGGLSNSLFTVRTKMTETEEISTGTRINTVLVRLHNPQEEDASVSIVNRSIENKISAELSLHGVAPVYYGRFSNGRLEQFYEGMRTLSYQEMSRLKYTRAIAIQLAKLHKVHVPCLMELELELEGCSRSLENSGDGDGDGDSDGDGCFRGQIWGRIDDWIHLAKKGSECASISNDNDELIPSMLAEIQTEWIWIQGELRAGSEGYKTNHTKKSKHDQLVVQRAMEFCRGVVFTHMDCQSLNIMTPEHAQDDDDEDDDDDAIADIRLIDFEYAGMNPRAVDLANTFAEFCDMNNLKPAYAAQYPSACVQDVFFMAYIRENDCALAKDLDDMGKVDVELFLLTMRGEVGKNSLLSHLCWSCWALIQFSASSIAFDYITYAKVRLEGYHFFKEKHWPHLY